MAADAQDSIEGGSAAGMSAALDTTPVPASSSSPAAQPGSPTVPHISERDSHIFLQVPRPASATAKRILCLSDTHDQHMFMPSALPEADILVHAGDFTCRGAKDELDSFCAWTDDLLAHGVVRDIVVVAGNHEISFELAAKREAVRRSQEAMKRSVTERSHVHYLQDAACEVQGVKFYGSPWCTRFGRDWAFQLADTPEELGSKYSLIPEGVDVLITHQPPFGQGDWNGCDKRTGSRILLDRVLAAPPLLHIFGHIHTGHGFSKHADVPTTFINAAVCDEDYKPIQKPFLVELASE